MTTDPASGDPPWQTQRRRTLRRDPAAGAGTDSARLATLHLLVVDDLAIYRDWVRDALTPLGCRVTAVDSGEAAIAAAHTARAAGHRIDYAIVDVLMPLAAIEGVACARALVDLQIPCVMFTAVAHARNRLDATLAGALGYVIKEVHDARTLLVQSVTALVQGLPLPDQTVGILPSADDIAELAVRARQITQQLALLTRQQRAVAAAAARGLTNREIAATLQIAPPTVSTHLQAVFERLGLTSRRALADPDMRTALHEGTS